MYTEMASKTGAGWGRALKNWWAGACMYTEMASKTGAGWGRALKNWWAGARVGGGVLPTKRPWRCNIKQITIYTNLLSKVSFTPLHPLTHRCLHHQATPTPPSSASSASSVATGPSTAGPSSVSSHLKPAPPPPSLAPPRRAAAPVRVSRPRPRAAHPSPSSPTRVPDGSAMPATGTFSWPPTPLWGRTASGGVGA
jgi:hypothetical protein